MTDFLRPRPLPTAVEYEKATAAIEREIINAGEGHETYFLSRIAKTPSMPHFSYEALRIGRFLEPLDRSTRLPFDETWASANAFQLGAVAGVEIATAVHDRRLKPQLILKNIPQFTIDYDPDDMTHTVHAVAQQVMQFGDRAFDHVGQNTEENVTQWSEKAIPDITKQRFFKIGTGVILAASRLMHSAEIDKYERDQLQKTLDSLHDLDWDEALSRVLNYGE